MDLRFGNSRVRVSFTSNASLSNTQVTHLPSTTTEHVTQSTSCTAPSLSTAANTDALNSNYLCAAQSQLESHHFHISPLRRRPLSTDPFSSHVTPFEELPYFWGEMTSDKTLDHLYYNGDFLLRLDPIDMALVLTVHCGTDNELWHQLLLRDANDHKFHLPIPPHADEIEEYIDYFLAYGEPIFNGIYLRYPVMSDKLLHDMHAFKHGDEYTVNDNDEKSMMSAVPSGRSLELLDYFYADISAKHLPNTLRTSGDYILRHDTVDNSRPMVSVRGPNGAVRNLRLPLTNVIGQYAMVDRSAPNAVDAHEWCEYHRTKGLPIKTDVYLKRPVHH